MKKGTPHHPKMYALAEKLKLPLPCAVGILEMLWHFTADRRPRGDIGSLPDKEIAQAVGWTKRPKALIDAMCEVGWLDRDDTHRIIVHDWPDHVDTFVCRKLLRSGKDFLEIYKKSANSRVRFSESIVEDKDTCANSGLPTRGELALAQEYSSEVSSEGDARGRRPDSDLDLEDDFATFAKNSSNRNRLWDRVKCSPKEQAQLGERGSRYEERMGIREVRLAWLVFLSDKLKGDKEIKNPLLCFYGGLDRGWYLEPPPATADARTPPKVGQSSSSGSPNAPAAQNGAARGLESPLPDVVSRNSLPAAAIRWNGTVTKAPPVVVWPPGDIRDHAALENALADAVFGDNFDKLLLSCQCLMEQGLPEKTACLTFGYMLNNWRKILNGGCNWMKADFTKSTKPKRLTIAEIAAL